MARSRRHFVADRARNTGDVFREFAVPALGFAGLAAMAPLLQNLERTS
jgi:hypothetical protein